MVLQGHFYLHGYIAGGYDAKHFIAIFDIDRPFFDVVDGIQHWRNFPHVRGGMDVGREKQNFHGYGHRPGANVRAW
jgi:hypothetical protein